MYAYYDPSIDSIVSRNSLLQALLDAAYLKIPQIALYNDEGISVLDVKTLAKKYFKEGVFDEA